MAEPSDFARLLDRLIHERFRRASAFCEAVGVVQSQVTRIIAGERPVPKDLLPQWAKALGLKGTEAEDFIIEGELADAPTAKKRIQALAARVTAGDTELAELRIRVDELRGNRPSRPGGSPGRPASR